jgi:uncharacterized lipoprotein YddW (UPF0748 family)
MPVTATRRPLWLCALVLLGGFAPGAFAQDRFRAFWADAFSVGFKNASQVNDMVNRAVSGRYNAIFVEVLAYHDNVGGGHGAYYNSSIIPKATDISSGFDPLATVINTAHAAGIEVHAWIVPYRVSSIWPPSGNAYLSANPQLLMVNQADMGGGPAKVDNVYVLDPGSPEVQEYLVDIVRELVANYDIDGINLDYIRYTVNTAGYPSDTSYPLSSLERFRDQTGFVGTPPTTGNTAWNDFRRQTIDEYVRRLRAEIPSIPNPRQPLRFTADVIAFGNSPSGNNFTATDAYNLFSNWEKWLESGWLDAAIPMNYKRDHISQQATWYRNWIDAAITWKGQRHLFAGQGNYLNTKANSVAQLDYALDRAVEGVVTFSYDATADENTNDVPEADWTWYTYVASNLFTTTVGTPDMPWRSPATATEGTLWGQVLDDASGIPIENATVAVGALPAVKTDGNGYYVVTLIGSAAGGTSYNVSVNASGCPVNAFTAIVRPGEVVREDVLVCPVDPLVGDMNLDGNVDSADLGNLYFCLRGPGVVYGVGTLCTRADADGDLDVDSADFQVVQQNFGQ